jgi:S-adenosylmethionine synthetase
MTNEIKITKTAEFVTPKHPDKICDFIADSILDAYLEEDKNSRVAVEVMGGHGLITLNGEVTSNTKVDIENIVKKIVGADYKIISNIAKQSNEIGRGVDTGGAGDQGIMCGYATNETKELLPLEYVLARDLCKYIFKTYPYDGKTQVTIEENKVKTIVASFQNTKNSDLISLIKRWYKENWQETLGENEFEILPNQAGEWTLGGFDADSGLSGRKLIVDNYGPQISIGGGSFSGKDYTKVDRSGAYAARKIAVEILKNKNAKEVEVKLAYAIGKSDPVMTTLKVDGKYLDFNELNFDLTPRGIKKLLNLENQKFAETCVWGHFGNNFEWDK